MGRVYRVFAALATVTVGYVCIPSCGPVGESWIATCADPNFAHFDKSGNLDPCCHDLTNPCHWDCQGNQGECKAKIHTAFWQSTPQLVWIGDTDKAPTQCPDPRETFWKAHDNPISLLACPETCECGAPSCVLPTDAIASAAPGCGSPFHDVPIAPDGTCSKGDIKANTLKSLGVMSPTVSPCEPIAAPADQPYDETSFVRWKTTAVVCAGSASGVCASSPDDACIARPTLGFMRCLQALKMGEEKADCPDGEYTHKHIVYTNFDASVSCTPCTCDPADDSVCIANVSAYQDQSCVTPVFENYAVPAGPTPLCVDVGANIPLQGIMASWITNAPATCKAHGGQPTGIVEKDHETAISFCCTD